MDPVAIGHASEAQLPVTVLRGESAGPAPDGRGLLARIGNQVFPVNGDPATPPGTPLLLATGSDGRWSAVATEPGRLPDSLRAALLEALEQNLPSLPPQEAAERREKLTQILNGSTKSLLTELSHELPPAGSRPALLRATSETPLPSFPGARQLEIEASLPQPSQNTGTGIYQARLGGQPVQIQGPEGLTGNQGLWRSQSAGRELWLTPLSTAVTAEAPEIPLPPRIPPTADGLRDLLLRLMPEAASAASPELGSQIVELSRKLAPALAKLARGENAVAAKTVDSNVALRLLDAWLLQNGAEGPATAATEEASETVRSLAAAFQEAVLPADLTALLTQLPTGKDGRLPNALVGWLEQHGPGKVRFPLGEGTSDTSRELSLSLAGAIAQAVKDAPELPQLRELSKALVGQELQARQPLTGSFQLPWQLPRDGGADEGFVRVVDRRRREKQDPAAKHHVEIDLHPETLGTVKASLELDAKHLRVVMSSELAGTADRIRAALPELADRLRALGLQPFVASQTASPASPAPPSVKRPPQNLDLQA